MMNHWFLKQLQGRFWFSAILRRHVSRSWNISMRTKSNLVMLLVHSEHHWLQKICPCYYYWSWHLRAWEASSWVDHCDEVYQEGLLALFFDWWSLACYLEVQCSTTWFCVAFCCRREMPSFLVIHLCSFLFIFCLSMYEKCVNIVICFTQVTVSFCVCEIWKFWPQN